MIARLVALHSSVNCKVCKLIYTPRLQKLVTRERGNDVGFFLR